MQGAVVNFLKTRAMLVHLMLLRNILKGSQNLSFIQIFSTHESFIFFQFHNTDYISRLLQFFFWLYYHAMLCLNLNTSPVRVENLGS